MSKPCFSDLRKEGIWLLSRINRISQWEFGRELRKLYTKDEIGGPLAVAHLMAQMKKACPVSEWWFWDAQIAACERSARNSWKIQRGWKQYGMTPWEVVHFEAAPVLPRYRSEPCLSTC